MTREVLAAQIRLSLPVLAGSTGQRTLELRAAIRAVMLPHPRKANTRANSVRPSPMLGPTGTIFGFEARNVFGVLVALFWLSEWLLFAALQPGREDRHADRGSGRWLSVAFPLAWGSAVVLLRVHRADFGSFATTSAGLALMVVGQLLRWWSMATLGRLFTVYVAIRDGHHVVQSGPYRYIRHPSYTAILLVHLGAALCFGNALSAVALLVPVSLALGNRIRVEEAVLAEALGPEYREYMTRTKRLVPGVY